jgi:oligoribonuclease (3'-5' exoribonuclease)
MTRELIFVDTETTGLDEFNDSLIEVSYATARSDIKTLYFGITEVRPNINKLIHFAERKISGRMSTPEEIADFVALSQDNIMVAACPAFDKSFLFRYGLFGFHYRMLDIESYAAGKLNLNYVPGMHELYVTLTERGYKIPEPTHTSASDVAAMRKIYEILRYM